MRRWELPALDGCARSTGPNGPPDDPEAMARAIVRRAGQRARRLEE